LSSAQKRKYLKYTLATGWLCLFIILLLSGSVLTGFINGNSASGIVVDKQVYIEQIRGTSSPRESELHEITVQYQVAGETYQIYANAQIYAGMGLIEDGDNLTVVYSPSNPAQALVLSYALYSPMVSILGYVTFVCFLVGFPRWLLWRNKPVTDEK
jgi:ABC-type Na+ efflux pump permease subunit